jgi:hypothetical protein
MRGHPPGSPKTPGSGRKRGTPNKVSVQTREGMWKHIEQLAAQGKEANPFVVLTTLMLDSEDEHIRVACAQALADRLLPKLKAVEHTGKDGGPIDYREMPAAQRQERIAALLAKRNGHAPSHSR